MGAHSDLPFSNFINHSDIPHCDTVHSDAAHSDIGHSDIGHSDGAHADLPNLIAHTDAGAKPGSLYQTGSELRYVGNDHNVYSATGTSTGTPGGAKPGSVYVLNDDLHYIDASGIDYMLQKTSASVVGPTAVNPQGSIWIDIADAPALQFTWKGTTGVWAWHADAAHSDAAHSDVAHTDVAHSDTAHCDVAHTDVPCWVAGALYGWNTLRFRRARYFIFEQWQGPVAALTRWLYVKTGRRVAQRGWLLPLLKPLFDLAVKKSKGESWVR